MSLTGEINGLKKGTIVLKKRIDSGWVAVDSVKIDGNSSFSFNEEVASPEIYVLGVTLYESKKNEILIPFFAEPSEININSNLKDLEIESTVTGSVNQVHLDGYSKLAQRYADKYVDLIEQSLLASKAGNDSIADALTVKQNRIMASKYLATVNYAIQYKDFEIAPYLMAYEINDVNPKYLDTVYNQLPKKIKDSKYGRDLESLIRSKNKN